MAHTTGRIPLDPNRRAIAAGISSIDGITTEPFEVNPSTGRLLVDASITSEGNILPSSFVTGQSSVGISAGALNSNTLTQGIIIQALSTNTVSIYIGPSGVTTSTGFELQPGQATSIAVNNTNVIYAISGTAGQGLCFVGS